jgi:hypothetical protein
MGTVRQYAMMGHGRDEAGNPGLAALAAAPGQPEDV